MKPEENQDRKPLFLVLKGMAVAVEPLCVLPLLAVARLMLGGGVFSWKEMGFAFIGLLVAALGGALAGWVSCRYDQKPDAQKSVSKSLHIMMYAVAPIVCFLTAMALWPVISDESEILVKYMWGLHLFASTGILIAGWVLTARNIPGSYTSSFQFSHFLRGAGIYALSLVFIAFFNETHPVELNIVTLSLPFSVLVTFSVILMNQGNIDGMMERRRHNKASLPGKIRVYNLIIITGMLAVVFAGLLFGNQIFAGLVWVGKKLLLLVIYIIMGILWILGRAHPDDESGGGGGKQDTSVYETLAQGATTSPLWNIVYVLLIALAVYLLVTFRKQIFRSFRSYFSRIGTAIYNFLMGRFKVRELGAEEGYYTDDVEVLTQEDGSQETEAFHTKRELKKALKQWQKITNPVEKVRGGYRLMVMTAKTGDSGVIPSDTTGQILGKNRETSLEPVFRQMNPVYDRVRYGDIAPTPEEVSAIGKEVEAAFESGGVAMKNLAEQMEREKKAAKETAKSMRKGR